MNRLAETGLTDTGFADRPALEAVGRVLTAIAGAGFELQPALDQIAKEARVLCAADAAFCFLLDGDHFRFGAADGGTPEHWAYEREHPDPIDDSSVNGRVALTGGPVQIEDLADDSRYRAAALRIGGFRTLLGVPMGHGEGLVGTFGLGRRDVRPFTHEEIALVSVFADQAAVAIRIARLLAAEHQAQDRERSLGTVLASIARSRFDVAEVLEAVIAESMRLCDADTGNIAVREGDAFWVRAVAGFSPEYSALVRQHRYEPDRGSVVGRVLVERGMVIIPDVLQDAEYALLDLQRVGQYRSVIGVPIWLDDEIIGVIANGRDEVRPFGEREIGILEAFADQVAIALNLARLLTESNEAAERESAVREVLEAISRTEFDLTGVLQAIIDTATRLTRADDGNIIREDAGAFGLAVFTAGVPASFREIIGSRQFGPERGSAMGRSLMELKPVQIVDVLADPEYTLIEAQQQIGFRTILAIPLMNEGTAIGVLSIWRGQVDPFSEAEIRLLTTFAEQAAVTMRLASVLDETREGYERESAVGQVLASIARSTFDLPSVLNAVTESAARLTHADSGNLAVIDGAEYRIAAAYGEKSAELKRMFEASRITLDRGSMAGRVTLERRTIQIPDVLADPEYRQLQMQEVVGFRTLLGVPLMRDGVPTGVLMMQRSEVRPFTDQEIALITTFADQAALAIANVELYETVERQRAALASFAPHVAGLLSSPEGEALLTGHRREISALFCDMRGFTAFAETAEPEELFSVLREYHAEVGRIALNNGGTVEHFAGDGFMIFFNDPTPVADHPLAATRAALAMHERFAQLAEGWHRRGYDLGLGIGISVGYATLGRIGFEGRYDYAGVGAVTNLAARLSSAAAAGETLLSQRAYAAVEGRVDAEPSDELVLKGFSHAVVAYRVTALRPDA